MPTPLPNPSDNTLERFDPCRHDSIGPADQARSQIDRSIARGPILILWDLLGSCNLRCPSCPVGNMPETKNAKGMIDDATFYPILAKLAREFPNGQLHFYNWTEPLIHPKIVEYCTAAAHAGFHLHLSSNLNVLKNAQGLMASGLKTFRISLSGFTQEIYGQTHRNGRIEKVKANMRRLSAAKSASASRTRIHVYYHKYRHNRHEVAPMEQFARQLGFEFVADWAYLMPLEKLFQYVEGDLPEADREFADQYMSPPLLDALEHLAAHRHESCDLIDQLTLDYRGNVALCCAVFDERTNFIGKYLDLAWPQLQRMKYDRQICAKCMHYGAHVFYPHLGNPQRRDQIDALARKHLATPPSASFPLDGPDTIRLPVLQPARMSA